MDSPCDNIELAFLVFSSVSLILFLEEIGCLHWHVETTFLDVLLVVNLSLSLLFDIPEKVEVQLDGYRRR